MNRILNEKEIAVIHMLRAKNPRNQQQLEAAGLNLNSLGSGLYREGFHIEGTELVVKVPRDSYIASDHSKQEVKMWKRLLRSPLSSAVPPLRYHNEAGVIVTDKIQTQTESDPETKDKLMIWKYKLEFPKGVRPADMHPHNIGVYNGRYVILDLGCFME